MALLHCEFFGSSTQKMSALDVIMPEGKGRGPFPVLYLLHGLSDNQTAWQRRTNIEWYVEGLPLIVVMPDGGRSFYMNGPAGSGLLAYEDHIVKDVVGFVDSTFPTLRRREGRALAGLSMGGFGSFMLALRHREKFVAGASHSGALGFAHLRDDHTEAWATALLGSQPTGGPYDCVRLAEQVAQEKNRPALRFDCGRQDFLIKHNRYFRKVLTQLDYPHTYKEYPGAHTWEYWDLHVKESIAFVMEHLKTPGKPQ